MLNKVKAPAEVQPDQGEGGKRQISTHDSTPQEPKHKLGSEWRSERRTCHCGTTFKPRREAQRHCCTACRVKEAKVRYRSDTKDSEKPPTLTVVPRSDTSPATRQRRASQWANWPICPVCKLWQTLPQMGLPRHMFCIAVRKRRLRHVTQLAEAA